MHMFSDPNPESQYEGNDKEPPADPRTPVVKLQVIYNAAHKLVSEHAMRWLGSNTKDYQNLFLQYKFDKDSNIIFD